MKDIAVDSGCCGYSSCSNYSNSRYSPNSPYSLWHRTIAWVVLVTFSSSLIAPATLAVETVSKENAFVQESVSREAASSSNNSSTNKIKALTDKSSKSYKNNKSNKSSNIIRHKKSSRAIKPAFNSKATDDETITNKITKETKETKQTHLFFSSQSNYQPYLEIGGAKYFNQNTNISGIYDLFIPLLQNDTNIVFSDLRIFDRSGSSFEGNAHIGYRKLFRESNQMIGIYGAYDHKRTDDRTLFNQITLGIEYWFNRWFIGGNAYKPVGSTKYTNTETKISINQKAEPIVLERNIVLSRTKTTNTNGYNERAFPGIDAELGFAITDNLTAYAGGYYFADNDEDSDVKTIAGPKIRLTYDYRKAIGRILGG